MKHTANASKPFRSQSDRLTTRTLQTVLNSCVTNDLDETTDQGWFGVPLDISLNHCPAQGDAVVPLPMADGYHPIYSTPDYQKKHVYKVPWCGSGFALLAPCEYGSLNNPSVSYPF